MIAYWPTVDRLWCRHDTGVDWTAVVEQLQVADAATLAELTSTALRSTAEALRANLALLFVLLRPFLWIVYYVLRWIADYLYHHGLDQWQAMVMGWWRWERRLTPRQHWYQVIGLTASVALYHVHRQGYLAKVYHRARALQRRLRKTYRSTMAGIAGVSYTLAVMLPHVLYWTWALCLTQLMPGLVRYLAVSTALTEVLAWWIPLLQSVAVAHDMGVAGDKENDIQTPLNKKNTPQKRKKASSTPLRTLFPRTTPRRRRPRAAEAQPTPNDDEQVNLEEQAEGLIDYWMVVGAIDLFAVILSSVPVVARYWLQHASVVRAVAQVRLLGVVWIYLLPYLSLTQHSSRPLATARQSIATMAAAVVEHVSSLVSPATWNRYVIGLATPFIQLAVTLRMISQPMADAGLVALQDWRTVMVPAAILFVPVLSSLAIVYTRDILPLANVRWSMECRLQYWIVHALASSLLRQLDGLLWWIPLSHVAVFVAWWALTLGVGRVYERFQRDLQYFGLLPGEAEESSLLTAVAWLLERLPKAASVDEPPPQVPTKVPSQQVDATVIVIDDDDEHDDRDVDLDEDDQDMDLDEDDDKSQDEVAATPPRRLTRATVR